jgi:hypothetical protein
MKIFFAFLLFSIILCDVYEWEDEFDEAVQSFYEKEKMDLNDPFKQVRLYNPKNDTSPLAKAKERLRRFWKNRNKAMKVKI